MSFIIYDLVFLAVFTLAVFVFLHSRKKNLKREGLMYLYRTQVGIKLIDWFGKKHARWLRPLQPVVITSGYLLMVGIVYFLVKLSYYYISSPYIAKALKVPVIFPLIPYLPEIFKIDFLPPFYFTYWIIIIAIIAIPHEFAHGIFAKLNKVRIKSTGFGFLGPFLAAFVEQDDKQMNKASKYSQLSVLAAGTFANVLMTILFGVFLWGFFAGTFVPAGVNFSGYTTSVLNISDVTTINGIPINDFNLDSDMPENTTFVNFTSYNNKTYFTNPEVIETVYTEKTDIILGYDDSPAFNAKLGSPISKFDGQSVTSYDELRSIILAHKPGDKVVIETIQKEGIKDYEVTLAERDGKAFLGVGISQLNNKGVLAWLYNGLAKIKNPYVYYESKWGEFGMFINNLLWWIVIISFSVALTNMLPLGPFDGGRFFMITIWGITGNREWGETAFKWATWLLLALVAAMMVKWVLIFF